MVSPIFSKRKDILILSSIAIASFASIGATSKSQITEHMGCVHKSYCKMNRCQEKLPIHPKYIRSIASYRPFHF